MGIKLNEMKTDIKKVAQEIKEQRAEFKQLQRDRKSCWKEQSALEAKTMMYRHFHIAYSMARGKTYEQIENKVREGNEPSWSAIEHWTEKYIFEEETA